MKVLALTSIRSEYDLMSSLYLLLQNDPEIDLKLLVGGAHNSSTFGMTVDDIKADGFDVFQIESLIDGDTSSSRLKSASLLLMSSIDLVKAFSPDLIIYAGDREEVLIGAMLGGYLSIPTVHFFGGDHACDGHIDNPVRHATSKMSTYHFVSSDEHKKRLIALGEQESRIYNIGSVALDKFYEIDSNSLIQESVAGLKIEKPSALFIFHPVEEEVAKANQIVSATLDALIERGFHIFVGKPNSDFGNSKIRDVIDRYSSLEDITIYGNLPRKEFVQLFKSCHLIVGNSSAGLLEAASIPIPCVNIGYRQRGRLCAKNVQFANSDKESILKALERLNDKKYQSEIAKVVNPYGSGQASRYAYDLIKKINFKEKVKKKEDPLDYV